MEVRDILRLARKWFWLLILAALVGGAAGLVVNHFQKKVYESDVTLFISSPSHNDNASLLGDQQAAKALANFPRSTSVLVGVLQSLHDNSLNLTKLASMVTVGNISDSQFVDIHVQDPDPNQAAQLATDIARQSIAQFQSSVDNIGQTQFEQNLQQEINTLATQINQEQQQFSNLQQQLAQVEEHPVSDPVQQTILINQLTARINQLDLDLGQLRQERGQLITAYTSQSSIQITFLQEAQVPQQPIGMGRTVALVIGALAGLIAIVGVILFIEQTDEVLRTRNKASKVTELPILIAIKHLPVLRQHSVWHRSQPEIAEDTPMGEKAQTSTAMQGILNQENGHDNDAMDDVTISLPKLSSRLVSDLVSQKQPPLAGQVQVPVVVNGIYTKGKAPLVPSLPAAFFTLGLFLIENLKQLAVNGDKSRSLLITSPEDGDGKTLVASRIALALATIGVKVTLIDANLRKPEVHDIFGLSNSVGLSSILTSYDKNDGSHQLKEQTLAALQETHEPNLQILSSGTHTDSLFVALSSPRMTNIVHQLREKAFVVIDAPSVLTSSEPIALASKSDSILIVVDARHTTAEKLKRSLETLKRVNVNIIGVVLNRADDEN